MVAGEKVLFYAFAKFVAYGLWCLLGLRLLAPRQASLGAAAKLGALRWLLGLALGVTAGVALGSVAAESVTSLYLGVYVPLRVVEWTIMAVLIRRASGTRASLAADGGAGLWVLGGIVVSFATDLASPEGMAGRFCVGRCLC